MQYIKDDVLKKIKLNKSNFYVAIDFDQTITSEQSIDTWDACGYSLGENYKKEAHTLYEKYAPIERDYTISFEQKNKAMLEWYYACLKLYYKYNLTLENFKNAFNEFDLEFRSGSKQFLYNMYKNNIPVIILSAGIGNVIELFLQKNNCYFDNIYIISNFIKFDENGNIKKFEGNLIHTLNKSMDNHINQEFAEKIENKKYRLLIGDFIEDKNMISQKDWDKTISIGFLQKNVQKNLEVYKHNFDIVLTGEDSCFETVEKLVLDF